MKRVTILTLLLMAFVSFATINSFADKSPPGVEISIDYELPQGIDVNFESQVAQVWQAMELNADEVRIAVYDCDLKVWPNAGKSINIYTEKSEAGIFCLNDLIDKKSINKNNSNSLSGAINQSRLSVDEKEVLSMFYNSDGERHAARNAVNKI